MPRPLANRMSASAEWITAETERTAEENKSESMLSIFFNDILALRLSNKINDNYWLVEDNKIYLFLWVI